MIVTSITAKDLMGPGVNLANMEIKLHKIYLPLQAVVHNQDTDSYWINGFGPFFETDDFRVKIHNEDL